jgi:hypothetical protein
MMNGLPLIAAYGAVCIGIVAGVTVVLPTVQASQNGTAARVSMGEMAPERTPNDMELQANRLAERSRLDTVLVDARPPVPLLPTPKPIFKPLVEPNATASAVPASTAPPLGNAHPTGPVAFAETTVLRPPSAIAPSAVAKSVETDGYKAVRVLGREADGRWRALALRGSTEVAVLVDDKGNVSSQ